MARRRQETKCVSGPNYLQPGLFMNSGRILFFPCAATYFGFPVSKGDALLYQTVHLWEIEYFPLGEIETFPLLSFREA